MAVESGSVAQWLPAESHWPCGFYYALIRGQGTTLHVCECMHMCVFSWWMGEGCPQNSEQWEWTVVPPAQVCLAYTRTVRFSDTHSLVHASSV